jgi:hypothetical protein
MNYLDFCELAHWRALLLLHEHLKRSEKFLRFCLQQMTWFLAMLAILLKLWQHRITNGIIGKESGEVSTAV